MKFATKSIQHYPPHLRHVAMLPHYLWKLKIQIFCRYSAHEENAKKLHSKCTNLNSPRCVTVYSKFIYVFLSKSCSAP